MNLYKITLRGMTSSVIGTPSGIAYVVAEDPTTAYKILRDFLDRNDLGFPKERELDKIELLANRERYPNGPARLHIQGNEIING